MTLTAPIPLPQVHDLRSAILAGWTPITATVHLPALPAASTLDVDAWTKVLAGARTVAHRALTKNLDPAGLQLEQGTVRLDLEPDPHGDGFVLRAVWDPA
jgi:hypothetical protein